jgi:hypothetical protein
MKRTIVAGSCLVAWALAACGSEPPPRYVVEEDLGGYTYRRYQQVLDIELPIEENAAVGYTAVYLRRVGEDVRIASAFVTVYERTDSLVAEILERLDTIQSYEREVVKREREYVWRLTGDDHEWLLWVSGHHVVKLGGPLDGEVPEAIAEAYLDLYPSDLASNGRAKSSADTAGLSRLEREERAEDEAELPDFMQEDEESAEAGAAEGSRTGSAEPSRRGR